jgi:Holliday junction resolvasome RuvABC endonuclease subunit
MGTVLGIDQSVRATGICVLCAETRIVRHLELVAPFKSTGMGLTSPHLAVLDGRLRALLTEHTPQVMVMEGYAYNAANKKFMLGEVGGIVKLAALTFNTPLYVAAPKQVKKFISGNASANKEQVMRAVLGNYGEDIGDDNLADAFALAAIAAEIAHPHTSRRCAKEVAQQVALKNVVTATTKRTKMAKFKEAM